MELPVPVDDKTSPASTSADSKGAPSQSTPALAYKCKPPRTLYASSMISLVSAILRRIEQQHSGGETIMEHLVSAAPHLFSAIATELQKGHPNIVCFVAHPLLETLEITNVSLLDAQNNSHKLSSVKEVYLQIEVKKHPAQMQKVVMIVSKFNLLQKLKTSCCNDDLLTALGANCPHLQVFDAEEDPERTITDLGLAYLSNCKELTRVIFNDDGDEYDYEDRYFGLTGRGLAYLLLALTKLQVLVCEPYLLREALRSLDRICASPRLLLMRSMHLRFAGSDLLRLAHKFCPALNELILEDVGEDCIDVLPLFESLKKLTLISYIWDWQLDAALPAVLSRLESLTLKNPKSTQRLDDRFLRELGRICTNLSELQLTFHNQDAIKYTVPISGSFFPNLRVLHLAGEVSLDLVATMLLSLKRCHGLGIYLNCDGRWDSFEGEQRRQRFEHILNKFIETKPLDEISSLHIFQWDVGAPTIKKLIRGCRNLDHIWGLDLALLCPGEISEVKAWLKAENRNIHLHAGSVTERVRGIPPLRSENGF